MPAADDTRDGRAAALAVAVALAAWPAVARAELPDEARDGARRGGVFSETRVTGQGQYVHLFGAAAVGRGLRLNNPYRLQTQLGSTGESLSLSATYLDLAVGAAFGNPAGLEHGGSFHFSEALEGIIQDVVTPSYIVLLRCSPRWLVDGRVGVPIVLRPDATGGLEAAVGAVWYAMAGIGLTAELVASIFYGAATNEQSVTTVPVLSLQLGTFFDYEVLP